MTGPAHRQIANSKFVDSYADILYNWATREVPRAQLVKNPPAMQESPARVPGQEDPLEKG